MHLWWDGGAKTTYLSTKMDWQAAAQSEWQVISALASLSEIFMHLLLYVDMLSLPIFHPVPLCCSSSQHPFFPPEHQPSGLISTCDLSDQVLCLLWRPQCGALYKMARREMKEELHKPVLLHQHWHCRPCAPISFEMKYNFYVSGKGSSCSQSAARGCWNQSGCCWCVYTQQCAVQLMML